MSRVLKRPMFSMGGSTSAGITSGLSRQGYQEAGSVDFGEVDVIAEQMRNRYGPVPKQGYNVYDFLTEWGLNMASSPPMGNVIQTAAGTARGPHAKMVEGKGKDEMAQYMANMSSTDKALAAFTDIEVSKQKANQLNKDFSDKRRVDDISKDIRNKAIQGSWESTIAGSMGLAQGQVEITNLVEERGLENVNVRIIQNTDETGKFGFNINDLDTGTVWYDPSKTSYMVVVKVKDDKGQIAGKEEYFNDYDTAIKNLNKETVIGSGDTPGKPIKEKKKKTSLFGIVDQSGTSYEEMQQGQKELEKKITERFSQEGDIYEGDTRGYGDIKRIVEHEKKKNEIEKDKSDLGKWWKTQASNYGAGYQGVN
jgi:hypothetical protein